jgi:RNA-directed DNA polymerase
MNESASKESAVSATTKQGSSEPVSAKAWVDRSIWTERMLAALENGVKGSKWFSLIDKVYRPSTLLAAWKKVKANRGAAGVDGQSVERFAAQAPKYLAELNRSLEQGTYRPNAVRRVDIPKGPGKTRPLGIPTVKDRIVQMAVKRVIEPIFEHQFEPMSYGFRPKRCAQDGLREVNEWLKAGYTHVVDADFQGFFDTIPHDRLMDRVKAHISDGRILALLEAWLNQDVMQEMKSWTPTSGTPQGAVISPLLANIYLHSLDAWMTQRGYRMVRYADDFVILTRNADQAQRALAEVQTWVAANGLTLHPDKTRVGDCRQRGQGFEFLGYRFEAGRRWVRKKSVDALKDKVRRKTRRKRGDSIATIVADLNPTLRGWFGYFKHAARPTFRPLDGFIRRRLRALLRRQKHRRGFGRCYADHRRWPNAYFADLGLFTMDTARRLASQSR